MEDDYEWYTNPKFYDDYGEGFFDQGHHPGEEAPYNGHYAYNWDPVDRSSVPRGVFPGMDGTYSPFGVLDFSQQDERM